MASYIVHLKYLLIQTQDGHQFLQLLIFQLPRPVEFRHTQTGKFLLSVIKSDLRTPHLSAGSPYAGTGFVLFQRKRNLFFGVAGLFHDDVSRCEMEE